MKLTPSDIAVTFDEVSHGASVIVTGVSDAIEYVDGKSTGKRLGTRYTCIAPTNRFREFSVKIDEPSASITKEMIDKDQEIRVVFENFSGKFYRIKDTYEFSAKATKINLVKKV